MDGPKLKVEQAQELEMEVEKLEHQPRRLELRMDWPKLDVEQGQEEFLEVEELMEHQTKMDCWPRKMDWLMHK